MDILATPLSVLNVFKPCLKGVECAYRFLRSLITARAELAVAKAKVEELESYNRELKRENESQGADLAALRAAADRRNRYRRILLGGCAVYELRPQFVGEGEAPQFLCPACFTRGIDSELVIGQSVDTVDINTHERRIHLKCLTPGCRFKPVYRPEFFEKAFKAAQCRAADGAALVQPHVAADAAPNENPQYLG